MAAQAAKSAPKVAQTAKKSGGKPQDNRAAALATALQQVEKSYGKGAVMRLGQCGRCIPRCCGTCFRLSR